MYVLWSFGDVLNMPSIVNRFTEFQTLALLLLLRCSASISIPFIKIFMQARHIEIHIHSIVLLCVYSWWRDELNLIDAWWEDEMIVCAGCVIIGQYSWYLCWAETTETDYSVFVGVAFDLQGAAIMISCFVLNRSIQQTCI